jgi:glyoxylase-like metal-dependent hydrolase (beta-lactamase superfamily II)
MFAPRTVFGQEVPLPEVVVNARKAAATAKIITQNLRGGVYVLMGSGGNIAVLPGPQGKVLVDAGMSTSQPQIVEALNAISPGPISHLINTHWHYDHTDGNEWMHAAGATIIAQDKCKARLSSVQQMKAFNSTFPAAPKGAIPTKTFAEKDGMKLNGVTLSMAHYEPAHTDTDIWIHFVEANVLHTGDTWFNGFYPFIDYSTGGSINGMIKAADRNLATAGPDTIIIPGHGPIGNRKQLQEFRDVLIYSRDAVATLKQQGKTLTEVVAAKPTEKYDSTYGTGFMKPEVFLGLVYQGV